MSKLAPFAILAMMVFTWVVAACATYTEKPKDDYDYEDDHSSAPPQKDSDKAA